MVEVEEVTFLLSVLTVFSLAFIIVHLLLLTLRKNIPEPIKPYVNFVKTDGLKLALLVAVVATLGSLYYSEIAGYEPCKYCWYQRIMMYPMVIILGMAVWKKDNNVSNYTVPIALVGGSVSTYHVITNGFNISTDCAVNGGIPCSVEFFKLFGFVTIPFMALIAFILIIIFTLSARK